MKNNPEQSVRGVSGLRHVPYGGRLLRYVYLMFCDAGDQIRIKIGLSKNPIARLRAIRTSSALEPQLLAVVQVEDLYCAQRLETDLHLAFDKWRTVGEWFCFSPADKAEFNHRSRAVLDQHSMNGRRLCWRKIPVGGLIALRKRGNLPLLGTILKAKGFSGAFEQMFPRTY